MNAILAMVDGWLATTATQPLSRRAFAFYKFYKMARHLSAAITEPDSEPAFS